MIAQPPAWLDREDARGHGDAERLSTLLVSLFAALALMLGAVGIYGVMSYVVSQRTRELGIRVALGARRSGVVKLVLRQVMVLAVVGVLLGAVAATALSRLLQSMLFEIGPGDPITYAAMILLILWVGFVACAVPALRAARADPIEILRQDSDRGCNLPRECTNTH